MLFVVPRGIYDDLFWLWASVRPSPSRVVTNDAMRDHKLELMPERSWHRWRASQIMGFGFRYDGSETEAAVETEAAEEEAGAEKEKEAEAEAEAAVGMEAASVM